MSIKSLFILLK